MNNIRKPAVIFFVAGCALFGANHVRADVPDSVFIYLYTHTDRGGHDGLHWAWSSDSVHWQKPQGDPVLMSSDYGTWGAEKRMYAPYVRRADGLWYASWDVTGEGKVYAHTKSNNLIDWKPQSYAPRVDSDIDGYVTISKVAPASLGSIEKISKDELRRLIAENNSGLYLNQRYAEDVSGDSLRFEGIEPLKLRMVTSPSNEYPISDMMMGIFFEDISRAADGGLYAELIQNRDFEYNSSDLSWYNPEWSSGYAWSVEGDGLEFEIDSVAPIHPNNPHFAVLKSQGRGGSLINIGFDGIALEKGKKYDFSCFIRNRSQGKTKLEIRLEGCGEVLGKAVVTPPSGSWRKVTARITATATCSDSKLFLTPVLAGSIDVDMVSLFPAETFGNRRNGLRKDLAESIAALHPRFVRFPGGCVAHGDGLGNIYRWKNTVGPLEGRKPLRNIWNYHQTTGLGYHEYFEFCEDIGAEPLPVVAAGVPCQNSSRGGAGQQGGIPLEDMEEYINEILGLIEYANGDASTTELGRQRAANGHPAPFNLKYLGIGNEDLISDVFEERFALIYKAVSEKYPEIKVIGTAGPFHHGSDYDEGWRFGTELGVPVLDEHYYETPGWFIYNNDYYDGYDRSRPHVYLGEYASKGNRLYNALAEAAYLCGVERNGDVVEMTSYAPLLAKKGHTNWNPDLIYFTNTEVFPTVNYHVQRLFGENAGTIYVPAELVSEKTLSPEAQVRLRSSVVRQADGSTIVKMVNILPVSAEISLDIPDGKSVTVTILTGKPDSESDFSITEEMTDSESVKTLNLQPYSFTIVKYQ